MKKFVYGSFVYEYELLRQERKTLSLTVKPNLRIVLKAPFQASDDRIELFLKRKWFWLEKQLSFFKGYKRKIYKKEYVSGEGFLYLGKQYLLVVRRAKREKIKLLKNKIVICSLLGSSFPFHSKNLLEQWYKEERKRIFLERLAKNRQLFQNESMPRLTIRDMDKRWGSFINKQQIVLNPKLIYTSLDCIDYVIVHELCHMKYKNHNKSFFQLLKEKYPTWEKVKKKLEEYAI